MKINGKPFTTIWLDEKDPGVVCAIDQRGLPFKLEIERAGDLDSVCVMIRDMHVRGAPLIGVAGAFGMYLAMLHAPQTGIDRYIADAGQRLLATRPTAVNLRHAIERVRETINNHNARADKIRAALAVAREFREEEIEACRRIAEHGLPFIKAIADKKKGRPVNILTHCNAGWLACVDYGTATGPIYLAHDSGIKLHVWVDETRPRNQGSRLTAYELGEHGVPHTVIADNAGGHLMQHGEVDIVIVGSDRTTATGDVCNKIGTYLKALAAHDNGIPFYAALPASTIDFSMSDGVREIPVENRGEDEVRFSEGLAEGKIVSVLVAPERSRALNPGFDVTPARLVTGIITERGVAPATKEGLQALFPERY